MKIGIFGGSFNPPHKMHKNIAKELIKQDYVDKVIFVPTGTKYEYKNNLESNATRYMMLTLMIENEKDLSLSKYELQDRPVYTYETLDHFKRKYPEDDIYFICGTDNLSYIDQWKIGDYILKNYKILVIKRTTDELEPLLEKYKNYQKNIIVTSIKEETLSSTYIREEIKKKKQGNIKKYLDKKVYQYIKENHLYEEKTERKCFYAVKSY